MSWVLTRGLATVRAEFNEVFPNRDKASDGSIGDQAHQTGSSGHNPDLTGRAEHRDGDALDEVRAIDVDRDLVPGSQVDWMERVVQSIVLKGRAGQYVPFRYIIYKRRIWSRTDGWRTRTYTGANTHDRHAHFSGDYTQTADDWTGSLGLASLRQEAPMALDEADKTWLREQMRTAVTYGTYDWLWIAANGRDYRGISYESVGAAIRGNLARLTADPAIVGVVAALAGLDAVDEAALAEALAPAVAAIVTPAVIAAVEANGGVPLTEDQVTEAVKTAMRQGTGTDG